MVPLAVNDWDVFEEARNMVVVYEGLHTYGGLADVIWEAMAIGIMERWMTITRHAMGGAGIHLGRR